MSRVVAVAGETMGIEARAEAQGRSIEGGIFEGERFCELVRGRVDDRSIVADYADPSFYPSSVPIFSFRSLFVLVVAFVVNVHLKIKKGPDAQLRRAQLDNLGFVWNPKRGRTKRFIEGG